MKREYLPTEHRYIAKSESGKYAVAFHFKHSNYYKNGIPSLEEAIELRNKALDGIRDRNARKQPETYARLIPVEQQCERCSRPHLPNSKYCERHAKRHKEER